MVSKELFTLLKQYAKDLSPKQKRELFAEEKLQTHFEHSIDECPFCHSKHIVKNGSKASHQRYICKDCHKSFMETQDTILKRTRCDVSVWDDFIKCMLEKKSIRYCAMVCGISVPTAFKWRHKILDAMTNMMNKVVLNGTVESDETFESVSFKGNRNLPRQAHKRGHSVKMKGLSKEKVCISCAVNHNGLSVGKVTNLGKPSWKDVNKVLNSKIEKDSVFVTDSFRGYDRIAYDMNLNHIKIKRNHHTNGIFNIQTINNYHMRFKQFINRIFNGVSTKYINNYVVYHNFLNFSKGTLAEKFEIMRNFVFTTSAENVILDNRKRKIIPL